MILGNITKNDKYVDFAAAFPFNWKLKSLHIGVGRS
jgi:hypothetical protein